MTMRLLFRLGVSAVICAVTVLLIATQCRAAEDAATHIEAEPIKFDIGPGGKIETIAMLPGGNVVAGVSWLKNPGDAGEQQPAPLPGRFGARRPGGRRPVVDQPRSYALKTLDAEGKVLSTRALEMAPKMIHVCDNGDMYVCGSQRMAMFNAAGKQTRDVKFSDILEGEYSHSHASGVTANDKFFFIAMGDGRSLRATEDIVRLNRDLTGAKVIVKKQFGCCAHIDLDVHGNELLIAENSRHRVNRFNFGGEKLGSWGRRSRTTIEGFAACCNPVNFDFGPGNVLYTAESGIGRVKRYQADGKYLGLAGYVDTTKFDRGSYLASQSCYIPVEVNKTGSVIYVMDVRANIIRRLVQKK